MTGAFGQIGSELIPALVEKFGNDAIIAFDQKKAPKGVFVKCEQGDVADMRLIKSIIKRHHVSTIYHLASLLSVTSEKYPAVAWDKNLGGLKNILDIAVGTDMKIFWPSSIAVFGPTSPRKKTPQHTVLEPITIYGATKVAGELLCQYYHYRYGVDVRSIRYPGVLSPGTKPGGGTTDYAVEIFHEAIRSGSYTSFLRKDTRLPMIYIDDAVRAAMMIMEAKPESLSLRVGYNCAGLSFSVEELAHSIQKHMSLVMSYASDSRQTIADSWPESIDDRIARIDWGWKPLRSKLDGVAKMMLQGISIS